MRIISTLVMCATNLLCTALIASGSVIYQSGALGPMGVTWNQVISGDVPASNIALFNFMGVRFQVSEEWIATGIGGHFLGGYDETSFFGAIVSLTDSDDFPDSGDLSTPDVLGVTIMDFPHASAETSGDLSVHLQPGWYAVVFGTRQFGTTGRGAALRNGEDFGSPSYIVWHPDPGWYNYSDLSSFLGPGNLHLFVEGIVIPEPTTAILLTIASGSLGGLVRRRRYADMRPRQLNTIS